ncbi:ligand-binding sensor domain-containing protein [Limnovirga soli]|uniref:histidine kinase n=1 Tax=Limnovirga soli TaxID=2656915 RepID=A0A8J8JV62_9BACT|nr:two-component regulator propeller domain-containing protein [Limnovirga soli]NNV56284.1 hypothetical protein [Limnovirga soli]
MKSQILILLLCMQIFALHSFCQAPLQFKHITTAEGLSQGHVSAIVKDYKGFMWFGTDGGLNKYDGYTFTIFKHDPLKPNSIADNMVLDILEDTDSTLWVATANGLDKFNRSNNSFTHYLYGNSIFINDIFEDHQKQLWIATKGGLYVFNKITNRFTLFKHYSHAANSLADDYVYDIAEDDTHHMWLATINGLNKYDPVKKAFTLYHHNANDKNSIGSNWIKTVFKDRKGRIWIGTQGSGVSMFNAATNNFTHYRHYSNDKNSISHNDILCFGEYGNGDLWIGTENGGINFFDEQHQKFVCYKNDEFDIGSISNNSIYSIYRDDIGNMWVGTWSNGVNFLPVVPEKFEKYTHISGKKNSLSNSSVLSIACDARNNLWIGTDGGGLNNIDFVSGLIRRFTFKPGKENAVNADYVLSVVNIDDQRLGLGYQREGMDILNTQTRKVEAHVPLYSDKSSGQEYSANTLYKDRNGKIWIGSWGGGLYCYDTKTKQLACFKNNTKDKTSLINDFINCILQDNDGNYWIGTDVGMDKLDVDKQVFIHYLQSPQQKGSISNNLVQNIFQDTKGRLWIATGGGLNLYDYATNTFKAFTEANGLPDDMIESILQDQNGNLWISTDNGIAEFNPETSAIITTYGLADGLQGNEFKMASSYRNVDGEMFFGGPNGLNVFHPDKMPFNNHVPSVYITKLLLYNKAVEIGDNDQILTKDISETKEIIVSHLLMDISFEFAALNYISPEKNQYAYRLEGFDDNWNNVGTKRSATYTNLDPGTYTFTVKGTNNDGVWNEKGASIKVIVTPPFWQTWWFILLAIAWICLLIFAFYRFRVNVIEHQKVQLEQKIKEQTAQLIFLNDNERKARLEAEKATLESERARQEADLANIELVAKNKELEQFAYVVSHDLQEPLRTTTSFIQLLEKHFHGQTDETTSRYLYFIRDAADRMKVLIKDLLEFSRIGANALLGKIDCNAILHNVLVDIDVAVKEANAQIHADTLPVLYGYATEIKLLLQNLIVNAIKFSRKDVEPRIYITVAEQTDTWLFTVKDNGIGIDNKFYDKIFVIFQRLHSKGVYEGSGIGLSHCKKIVSMHKGKIWVESTPGEGSTFYFTIAKNLEAASK